MDEMKNIPVDQIRESVTNPRKYFDPQKMAEITDSIRAKGVVTPVGVRPHPQEQGYELVLGARRLRGTIAAGHTEIPAMIKDLSDLEAREARDRRKRPAGGHSSAGGGRRLRGPAHDLRAHHRRDRRPGWQRQGVRLRETAPLRPVAAGPERFFLRQAQPHHRPAGGPHPC